MFSRIPDEREKIQLMNLASWVTVKSRFPPRYFAFSRIPHRILVKSRIPKIPRVLFYGERTFERFTLQWNLDITNLYITKSSQTIFFSQANITIKRLGQNLDLTNLDLTCEILVITNTMQKRNRKTYFDITRSL